MATPFCPNLQNCNFINSGSAGSDNPEMEYYLSHYCRSGSSNWKNCRRLETKAVLDFCPDFVVPDSQMTIDQIIEMFDEQNNYI
jgi:hypothetical protein